MYFVHTYGLHVYCVVVDLDSSGSPGVPPTPGLTSSTQGVCVCVRAYTSTHPPTALLPAKVEKYSRQTPYIYPCQNIASHASYKCQPWNNHETSWKTPHFQSTPTHIYRCWKSTCDTHACSREIGQYIQTKCAYMSAYVHPHVCVYKCICIHIHRQTYIHIHTYTYLHIHACMHTHIHTHKSNINHVYAHLYTDRKSHQRRLNASSNIIDAHTDPYTYACKYTYLYAYTHMCTHCSECVRRCVRWFQKTPV